MPAPETSRWARQLQPHGANLPSLHEGVQQVCPEIGVTSRRREPRARVQSTNALRSHRSSKPCKPPVTDCPICCEVLLLPVKTSCCQQPFCFFCLVHTSITSCPMCRCPIPLLVDDGDETVEREGVRVVRSTFLDLEIKIFGDSKRWGQRLVQVADRIASLSPAAINASLPLPEQLATTAAEGKEIVLLRKLCFDNICDVRNQLRLVRSNVGKSAGALELLCASLDSLVHTVLATGAHNVTLPTTAESSGLNDAQLPSTAHDALRRLLSFHTAEVSDEQCGMFFANGFMRRRAPSLLVIAGGDDSEEVGEQQRSSNKARQAPLDLRSQLRRRLEELVAPDAPPAAGKLPVLIDVPEDSDSDASNFGAEHQPQRLPARGKRFDMRDSSSLRVTDATPRHKTLVAPPRHSVGGLPAVAACRHVNSTPLPPNRANLQSADTRMQSDLRAQIKLASAHAARKTERQCSSRKT